MFRHAFVSVSAGQRRRGGGGRSVKAVHQLLSTFLPSTAAPPPPRTTCPGAPSTCTWPPSPPSCPLPASPTPPHDQQRGRNPRCKKKQKTKKPNKPGDASPINESVRAGSRAPLFLIGYPGSRVAPPRRSERYKSRLSRAGAPLAAALDVWLVGCVGGLSSELRPLVSPGHEGGPCSPRRLQLLSQGLGGRAFAAVPLGAERVVVPRGQLPFPGFAPRSGSSGRRCRRRLASSGYERLLLPPGRAGAHFTSPSPRLQSGDPPARDRLHLGSPVGAAGSAGHRGAPSAGRGRAGRRSRACLR